MNWPPNLSLSTIPFPTHIIRITPSRRRKSLAPDSLFISNVIIIAITSAILFLASRVACELTWEVPPPGYDTTPSDVNHPKRSSNGAVFQRPKHFFNFHDFEGEGDQLQMASQSPFGLASIPSIGGSVSEGLMSWLSGLFGRNRGNIGYDQQQFSPPWLPHYNFHNADPSLEFPMDTFVGGGGGNGGGRGGRLSRPGNNNHNNNNNYLNGNRNEYGNGARGGQGPQIISSPSILYYQTSPNSPFLHNGGVTVTKTLHDPTKPVKYISSMDMVNPTGIANGGGGRGSGSEPAPLMYVRYEPVQNNVPNNVPNGQRVRGGQRVRRRRTRKRVLARTSTTPASTAATSSASPGGASMPPWTTRAPNSPTTSTATQPPYTSVPLSPAEMSSLHNKNGTEMLTAEKVSQWVSQLKRRNAAEAAAARRPQSNKVFIYSANKRKLGRTTTGLSFKKDEKNKDMKKYVATDDGKPWKVVATSRPLNPTTLKAETIGATSVQPVYMSTGEPSESGKDVERMELNRTTSGNITTSISMSVSSVSSLGGRTEVVPSSSGSTPIPEETTTTGTTSETTQETLTTIGRVQSSSTITESTSTSTTPPSSSRTPLDIFTSEMIRIERTGSPSRIQETTPTTTIKTTTMSPSISTTTSATTTTSRPTTTMITVPITETAQPSRRPAAASLITSSTASPVVISRRPTHKPAYFDLLTFGRRLRSEGVGNRRQLISMIPPARIPPVESPAEGLILSESSHVPRALPNTSNDKYDKTEGHKNGNELGTTGRGDAMMRKRPWESVRDLHLRLPGQSRRAMTTTATTATTSSPVAIRKIRRRPTGSKWTAMTSQDRISSVTPTTSTPSTIRLTSTTTTGMGSSSETANPTGLPTKPLNVPTMTTTTTPMTTTTTELPIEFKQLDPSNLLSSLAILTGQEEGNWEEEAETDKKKGEGEDEKRPNEVHSIHGVGYNTQPILASPIDLLNVYPRAPRDLRTNFDCRGRAPGRFYVDVASKCQVFHHCGSPDYHQTFICPNGTRFSLREFHCDLWYRVDCHLAINEKHDGIFGLQPIGQAKKSFVPMAVGPPPPPRPPRLYYPKRTVTGAHRLYPPIGYDRFELTSKNNQNGGLDDMTWPSIRSKLEQTTTERNPIYKRLSSLFHPSNPNIIFYHPNVNHYQAYRAQEFEHKSTDSDHRTAKTEEKDNPADESSSSPEIVIEQDATDSLLSAIDAILSSD